MESNRKRLRIYNSFEEAAEDEAAFAAQQSPIERLRLTVQLILRAYGVTQQQLNDRPKSKHIKIVSYK